MTGTNHIEQDIAPNYYDLGEFKRGDVKNGLQKVVDKMRRKDAMKKGSR